MPKVILPTIRQEAQDITSLVIINHFLMPVTVPLVIATLEWPCMCADCEGKCGGKWEVQAVFGLS